MLFYLEPGLERNMQIQILDIGTGSGIIALMLAQRSMLKLMPSTFMNLHIEDAELNFKKFTLERKATS